MILIEKNWLSKSLLRVLSWTLFVVIVHGPPTFAADVDVCVIGAGPSGVQAAVSAEAAGLSVALFEKDSFVGGKTKTVEVEGLVFPMGAVTDIRAAGNSIESLLEKYDTPVLLNNLDIIGNVKDGTITRPPSLGLWEILSGLRYFLIRILIGFTLDSPDGYLKPSWIFGKYWLPARDWLAKKGLLLGLAESFWTYGTCLGYGQVSETPIIYYFKEFRPSQVINFDKNKGSRTVLFQELFKSLVGTLKGQVFLSANITNAIYGEEETTLTFSTAQSTGIGTSQQLTCGSTIIAFAPILSAIDVFTPPFISTELKSLASQIKTINYYTVLLKDNDNFFKAPGVYRTPRRDEVPDNPAEILLYLKVYEGVGTPVLAYYFSPSAKTEEQAREEILTSYSNHIGASAVLPNNAILAFEPWLNYFPHALTDALQEGFFPSFDELQGVARQYYVGGLFNFEIVQNSMEHARFVVEKHLLG